MGFINKLFKEKQSSWKKEKVIPEYHKCPMCGEMVKTHKKLYSDNPPRYLDGEPKITTKEIVKSLQFCEHCGYIYDEYDYTFYKTTTPSIPIDYKKRFQSDSYQNVLKNNDIDPYYKKLLLYDLILGTENSETQCSLYYEYKYQFENKNTEKETELLALKLQEALAGKNAHTVHSHKLCYDNQFLFSIGNDGLVIDLLRRSGKFEEAKELTLTNIAKYEKEDRQGCPKHEYLLYQLQLIEAQDKRHI